VGVANFCLDQSIGIDGGGRGKFIFGSIDRYWRHCGAHNFHARKKFL